MKPAYITRLSQLTPARQRLVRCLQAIHFGKLETLTITDGQPDWSVPPRITREVKFGGEDARPEHTNNFLLKQQVVELLTLMDQLGTGTIAVLEVKHGLPFRVLLHESPVV